VLAIGLVLAVGLTATSFYIVCAPTAGSLWIMANLNHNMMPMDQLMRMQR
jgi:cytochrome o ubiquinol oxidase operon protein cyoD